MPAAITASSKVSIIRTPFTRTKGFGVFKVIGTKRLPNPAAIKIATENASRLPIGSKLHFEKRDIKDFRRYSERGTVICNPPYGERLLDLQAAEEIYKTMGRVFTPEKGWSYYVITPDEEFENCFGRKADKSRKLYNGMIKCDYYMFTDNQRKK